MGMRTALVTGSGGAIGAAIARRLAADGFSLILHFRETQPPPLPGALRLRADLRSEAQITALFRQIENAPGGVDLLVNNAGVALPPKLIQETTAAEFDDLFAVNTRAAFLCCRAAVPSMVRRSYGRIVNVSSMWGVAGASCEVAYSAAKAAVIGLTRALAKELGPSGVTVNCVAPGVIQSPMNAHLSTDDLALLRSSTPVGRLGTPEDVADVVSFFAAESSGFITGQTLLADGGFASGY